MRRTRIEVPRVDYEKLRGIELGNQVNVFGREYRRLLQLPHHGRGRLRRVGGVHPVRELRCVWTGCIFHLCKVEQSSISRNIPSTMVLAFARRYSLAVVPCHVCGATIRRVSRSHRSCFIVPGAVFSVVTVSRRVRTEPFRWTTVPDQ